MPWSYDMTNDILYVPWGYVVLMRHYVRAAGRRTHVAMWR